MLRHLTETPDQLQCFRGGIQSFDCQTLLRATHERTIIRIRRGAHHIGQPRTGNACPSQIRHAPAGGLQLMPPTAGPPWRDFLLGGVSARC